MPQTHLHWHHHPVQQSQRAAMKGQRAFVLWFTGLSGSGKSSIAGAVECLLAERGKHTYLLDGDNIRYGLCADLGFSAADRTEHIRRVGEVASLMVDAGLIVLAAFISPERAQRENVRQRLPAGQFIEVFVDVPLPVCESRDVKGLYQKARAGLIADFTGVHSGYEAPENPEIVIRNHQIDIDAAAAQVLEYLQREGYLDRPDT